MGAAMSNEPLRRRGAAAGADRGARGARSGLALRYRDNDLPLTKLETVIGRAADCDIMLPSELVSRRHARVVLDAESAVAEDLGSRNGTFVNGEQLDRPRRIAPGDRVQLGGEVLELVSFLATDPCHARDTIRTPITPPGSGKRPCVSFDPIEERTREASAFVLLGGLLDKLLAMGRGEEAERLMSSHLERVMCEVELGKTPESARVASEYAVRLAEATGKARWVDYVVRLHLMLARPLPVPQIDVLHAVVRRTRGIDIIQLREYVGVLKARAAELGPAERFALRRIEGLADVAAL
jgi:hypothetical protein